MLEQQWQFDTTLYKPLLPPDITYWTHTLNKVLKVGIEFEFNLPEAIGQCEGQNKFCPCMHLFSEKANGCWLVCDNVKECEHVKSHGIAACYGQACTQFVPKCNSCVGYLTNCGSCVLHIDPKKSPNLIRRQVREELCPTSSYGRYGKSGCHKVIQDGSLLGDKGMEIVTIGRRVDFWEFYKMTKKIIDLAAANNAYVNELCSIHMHVLTSYYGQIREERENDDSIPSDINELEHPMPAIIAANFHQLCRKYQNAITWMSMGLDDPKHLTRWEKYRMSILSISPAASGFKEVVQKTAALGSKHKYAWANYMFTRIDGDGDIDRFHVEMRVLDCLMSPTAVSAFACLFHALVLRAVELSRYGLLYTGKVQWAEKALALKDLIMNKSEGWPEKTEGDGRKSDTGKLLDCMEILVAESNDLLNQVKHILSQTGPAYEVLSKLASTPIALLRCSNKSWEEIEAGLAVTKPALHDEEIAEAIDKYICLRLLNNCSSMSSWIKAISTAIVPELKDKNNIPDRVKYYVESQQLDGRLVWSSALGTAMKIQ